MPKANLKLVFLLLFTVTATFGLTVSLSSLLAAWNPPSAEPPAKNVSKPIYSSSTVSQITDKSLAILGNLSADNIYAAGKIGIGDASPDTGTTGNPQALKLDVEGAIGASAYCDQDGNNCTSMSQKDFGYEIIDNIRWGNLEYNHSASCPAGKEILGGGCLMFDSNDLTANHPIISSYPSGTTSWHCGFLVNTAHSGWQKAYAICADMK
jgi:hypothetical protein